MSGLCAAIIIALVISLPILLLVIAVRAIIKKPIKKVAIALAICASSIIPLTILGVVTDPATWCEHQYTVVKEATHLICVGRRMHSYKHLLPQLIDLRSCELR